MFSCEERIGQHQGLYIQGTFGYAVKPVVQLSMPEMSNCVFGSKIESYLRVYCPSFPENRDPTNPKENRLRLRRHEKPRETSRPADAEDMETQIVKWLQQYEWWMNWWRKWRSEHHHQYNPTLSTVVDFLCSNRRDGNGLVVLINYSTPGQDLFPDSHGAQAPMCCWALVPGLGCFCTALARYIYPTSSPEPAKYGSMSRNPENAGLGGGVRHCCSVGLKNGINTHFPSKKKLFSSALPAWKHWMNVAAA